MSITTYRDSPDTAVREAFWNGLLDRIEGNHRTEGALKNTYQGTNREAYDTGFWDARSVKFPKDGSPKHPAKSFDQEIRQLYGRGTTEGRAALSERTQGKPVPPLGENIDLRNDAKMSAYVTGYLEECPLPKQDPKIPFRKRPNSPWRRFKNNLATVGITALFATAVVYDFVDDHGGQLRKAFSSANPEQTQAPTLPEKNIVFQKTYSIK